MFGSSQFKFFFRNSPRYFAFYEQSNYPVLLLCTAVRNDMRTCVQLLITSCVFSLIVQSYVIQGQGHRYTLLQLPVLRLYLKSWKEAIKILSGSTKYKGIYGYVCDNVMYPEIW